MIIVENKTVRVEFDPSIPAIIWTPLEFMEGEFFRAPFNKGMDYFEDKVKEIPNLSWLNDARKLKSVKPDDVRWIKNINERAEKLGGRKVAFVLPENIFGKMAVKLYVEFTNSNKNYKLQVKAFNSFEKAKNWLKGNIIINQSDEVKL